MMAEHIEMSSSITIDGEHFLGEMKRVADDYCFSTQIYDQDGNAIGQIEVVLSGVSLKSLLEKTIKFVDMLGL